MRRRIVPFRCIGGVEVVSYCTIVESVKRDCVGLLVGEDIAGGAFIVISKMGDSVPHFCSVCRVEVVDLSWAVGSQERYGVTRITASFSRTCACLEVDGQKLIVSHLDDFNGDG